MIAALGRALFALVLVAAGASAEGLKLPDNLTDLRSPEGEALPARDAFARGLFSNQRRFRDPEDAILLRRRQHGHGA
jgi:hypothetical protein